MFWEYFGAPHFIHELSKAVAEIESKVGPDERLVVTMQTPDGRSMLIGSVAPRGQVSYIAEGLVEEMACTVMGHISNLQLFFVIEKGKRAPGFLGFSVRTEETSESQSGSLPEERSATPAS